MTSLDIQSLNNVILNVSISLTFLSKYQKQIFGTAKIECGVS